MLPIIIVLAILWGTKNLTNKTLISTAFITCYVFEFLVVYGQGATLADTLYYTVLYGSGYSIVSCILGKVIFRKKIERAELGVSHSSEPLQEPKEQD